MQHRQSSHSLKMTLNSDRTHLTNGPHSPLPVTEDLTTIGISLVNNRTITEPQATIPTRRTLRKTMTTYLASSSTIAISREWPGEAVAPTSLPLLATTEKQSSVDNPTAYLHPQIMAGILAAASRTTYRAYSSKITWLRAIAGPPSLLQPTKIAAEAMIINSSSKAMVALAEDLMEISSLQMVTKGAMIGSMDLRRIFSIK